MSNYIHKECRICKETKGSWEFYKNKKGHLAAYCRGCYSRRYRQLAKTTKPHLKSKFGLTVDNFNAMLLAQKNECALCKRPHLETPEKKWGRAQLAVDHCHSTGVIRGLLCFNCNTGLGHFKEDVNLLTRAVEYLNSGGIYGGKIPTL